MEKSSAAEPSRLQEMAALLTRSSLERGIGADQSVKLIRKLSVLVDREIQQLSEHGRPRACRRGCCACCSALVSATPPEIATLASSILSDWIEVDRGQLVDRLRAYVKVMDGQRDERYLRFREPCPLLVDSFCSIYDQRPLFCRAANSSDAELCELWKVSRDPHYPIESPNNEDRVAIAVQHGIAEGSREAGLPPAVIPMAPALLALLEAPARLETLIRDPRQFVEAPNPPWHIDAAPVPGEPIGLLRSIDPDVQKFDSVRRGPPELAAPILGREKTAHLMLRLMAPTAYRESGEIEGWRAYLNGALDDALGAPVWNPKEAYNALRDVNILRAGYGAYSMKGVMSKFGKLVNERIASKVAPDLLDEFATRRPGKLRIGFASYNIRAQSGGKWAYGWVKNLDRSQFEVHVFKLMGDEDAISHRFKDAADHYVHFTGSPLQIARRIRDFDLDYLIYPDLADLGYNYQLACFRLARRQATGWGCPFTSGLSTIDDYLSSDLMEPVAAEAEYTENLVRLPNTGVTYPPFLPALEHKTRGDFGLPEGHLVILGQYLSKWLPGRDSLLARISERVKNPILIFDYGSDYQKSVFRERMDRAGVRIQWMPQTSLPVFQRIVQLCDASLDPPDWSGGHTSYGTLQFGTPLVSLPGEFMRGRQSIAYLTVAGVPELLATSEDDYVDLATNPDRHRNAVRNLDSAKLFNDEVCLRAVESHVRM